VLEHIEDDKSEPARAIRLLRPGGRLIVLVPAHEALYSRFDKAIGHYRRYDRESLRSCSPPSSRLEKMEYRDCVGLIASTVNKFLLKQTSRRCVKSCSGTSTWFPRPGRWINCLEIGWGPNWMTCPPKLRGEKGKGTSRELNVGH
jgi:hypothetical protein